MTFVLITGKSGGIGIPENRSNPLFIDLYYLFYYC